jgi:hypothetical protein
VQRILDETEPYTPSSGTFITAQDDQLYHNNRRISLQGVNYYPRQTPFARFLTQTSAETMRAELAIIASAGFNTVRVFVRMQDLFVCAGSGGIPNLTVLRRFDRLLRLLDEFGLWAIVVLHHDPDLTEVPLYSTPPYLRDQLRFLVTRYRDEPIIAAWDIRDRGDQDYLSGAFSREQVLTWASEVILDIRRYDPNHLITAGWWQDSLATAPLVDFISFQHYGEYEAFRQVVAILKANTRKPIVLAAIGYTTFAVDETVQRNLIFQAIEEVNNNRLAGWLVYSAFDHPVTVTCVPPECPAPLSEINRYGIWNESYQPKLVLEALQRLMSMPAP